MVKVAINGFGRIGREILRIALQEKIDVVAVNDLGPIKTAAYLFKYDSIHGKFPGKIKIKSDNLNINGKNIHYLNEKDPSKLPWEKLDVDIVIESAGLFRDREGASKHLEAGAKRVLISAPGIESDITVVPGVNHNKLKKEHKIISIASCTTNCLAPVLFVLEKNVGIKKAMMTTVHSYTNDQEIQDSFHKKPRRGRAAALNIIPTTTGASEAVCEVIPELIGKISGTALRVPVANGSIVDLTVELKKRTTTEEINKLFKKEAEGKLKGILEYTEDPIVSSDVIGNSNSAIIDALSTQVSSSGLIKILAWYDNEYGYSNRVVDVIKMLK